MFNSNSALVNMLSTRTKYKDLEYAAPFTKEFMDEKARTGDPLADKLVAQMNEDGLLGGAWRDMIDIVVKEAKSRGGIYQEFMDYCYNVPDWVDFELMKPSQRMIFSRIPNTLFTGSLTFFGGAFVPSALSVAAASQFASQGTPRLIESGTFILKPALGMKPNSIAHYELIRVRVIHAAIRFFMGQKRGEHIGDGLLGEDEYVNQTQMAYFLTSFSFLHLRTCIRLGMKLTDKEIMSPHHRWQYMGYLLGVDEDLLTDDLAEEKKLAIAALKRETKPELTDTLFLYMLSGMINKLGEKKSEKAREESLLEFKAVLLDSIGDDFIGGWGLSWDEPGMREALKRAKKKVARIDFIQRIKPVEMLQHFIVKKQFVSQRKKLLLAIPTTGGEDALGEVHEKKERGYTMKRFDNVIRQMEGR